MGRASTKRAGKGERAGNNKRDSKGSRGRREARGVKQGLFGSAAQLRGQLASLGLCLVPATGDGNCLFRALSTALWGDEEGHDALRALAVAWVAAHSQEVSAFLDEDEDGSVVDYVARMGSDGVWGGNVELVALSRGLHVEVYVHQSGHPSYTVSPGLVHASVSVTLHVGYSDGDHYDSVRLEGDTGGGGASPIRMPTEPGERAVVGPQRAAREWPSPEALRVLAQRLVAGGGAPPPVGGTGRPGRPPGADEEREEVEDAAVPDARGDAPTPAADAPAAPHGAAQGHEGGVVEAQGCATPHAVRPSSGTSRGGRVDGTKPRRNGPCPCGSLKLYRKCCEGVDGAAGSRAKAVAKVEGGGRGDEDSFAAIAI